MLFRPTFICLLSTATILHRTLASDENPVIVSNRTEDCSRTNSAGGIGFSTGSEFCIYHPSGFVIRSLWIWSNTTMIGGIQVEFADGFSGTVNTSVIDHPILHKLDLHPVNTTIRSVDGEFKNDTGLLGGIAITLSDGNILRAGENVTKTRDASTNNELGYSYIAAISGHTGTYGIENLNFALGGNLGYADNVGNSSDPSVRRRLSKWRI